MEKVFDMSQHMAGYPQSQPMDQRFGPMQQAWPPYPSHTSFSPYHPYPRSFDMFQGNFMDGRLVVYLCVPGLFTHCFILSWFFVRCTHAILVFLDSFTWNEEGRIIQTSVFVCIMVSNWQIKCSSWGDDRIQNIQIIIMDTRKFRNFEFVVLFDAMGLTHQKMPV